MLEINSAAVKHALDVIKDQKAKGAGASFPQERTATVVALVSEEMRGSFPMPEDYADGPEAWDRRVVFAMLYTGPLMQGSTLQKAAVKAGIYDEKATGFGYGV